MVYLLPLYHPLRLIDEVCMLDQMSGGRFLYGVGRGISPIEVGFYGVDFDSGMEQFREAYEVIHIGLTENELTYHGKFYDFDHVPIVMKPVQKPFPELWYGTSRPDSIPWAAEHGAHIVTLRDTSAARAIIDLYKAEWRKHGRADSRSAEDGDQPPHRRRRYRRRRRATSRGVPTSRGAGIWSISGRNTMCRSRSAPPCRPNGTRCKRMATRSPARRRRCSDYIATQAEAAGASYFVCDFAFGTIGFDEAMRSIELFATKVMPAFK